jgi:hypothetical protein
MAAAVQWMTMMAVQWMTMMAVQWMTMMAVQWMTIMAMQWMAIANVKTILKLMNRFARSSSDRQMHFKIWLGLLSNSMRNPVLFIF